MQKIQVSASILSADMCNLEAVVRTLETSGTDMLHFDVMDGRFVDNISFGIPVLEAIRKKTDALYKDTPRGSGSGGYVSVRPDKRKDHV